MNRICLAILIALIFCAHSAHASRGAEGRVGAVGGAAEKPTVSAPIRNAPKETIARNTTTTPARSMTQRQKVMQVRQAANVSRSAKIQNQKSKAAARKATRREQIGAVAPIISGRRVGRVAATMGADYAACRDTYTACMDQFCDNASETYKKCICSDKYLDLAAQREAIESAENALADFNTINLNMIQMTKSEAEAVLSATKGEQSMKEDTSANSQKLNEILDSLGASDKNNKGKYSLSAQVTMVSLDIDDVWSGGSTEGVIGENVRGRALFTAVNTQCQHMVRDVCKGANLSMVVSNYSMAVDADCIKFQSGVDKMRLAFKGKIRQAGLAMFNERLADFDNRNSLSAIECLDNVMKDFRTDSVCGEDWKKCLDFTGKYIDQSGEPILTPDFADGITSLLSFGNGNQTLMEANSSSRFVSFLEERKSFAGDSLRQCEQDANVVWAEAMNRALLEIIQAQSRKVDSAKSSCLEKLAECTGSTVEEMSKLFEDNERGAHIAAREACRDIQRSCEALFGQTFEELIKDTTEAERAAQQAAWDARVERSQESIKNNSATEGESKK